MIVTLIVPRGIDLVSPRSASWRRTVTSVALRLFAALGRVGLRIVRNSELLQMLSGPDRLLVDPEPGVPGSPSKRLMIPCS